MYATEPVRKRVIVDDKNKYANDWFTNELMEIIYTTAEDIDVSKRNKQRFEFCVGISNSHRSTIWKIVVDKSDVYIMSKAYGRAAKVSLHQSGVCQIAMTREKIDEVGIPREERPGERWQYTSEENTANNVLTIDILNCFLVDFSAKEETSPDTQYIAPPEDGRLTEIVFYKINTTMSIQGAVPDGFHHLCDFALSNGEHLTVCYHYPEFTTNNQQLVFDGYHQIVEKARSANLLPAEMIGYITTKPANGHCRLIEIFVPESADNCLLLR